MMTRKEYLAAGGRDAHRQYYGEIAEATGVVLAFNPDFLGEIKAALAEDEHLNNIPLHRWDSLAYGYRGPIEAELRRRGDFWSDAGGVCVMKEAARLALRR